ncbi:MAG TPA: hypothetical protein VHO71_01295 [Caproiciproducens sp.]|nr:hypothetical protein [Caproiciproducens sp.]
MFKQEIMVCLEQKKILLTHILNITKQIEVRCKEEEVALEHLLEQRKSFMDRVTLCNHMIQNHLCDIPTEQRLRIELILDGKIAEADCDADELPALKLVNENAALFQTAAELDKSANEAIRKQYAETRDKLKELRHTGKGNEVFFHTTVN